MTVRDWLSASKGNEGLKGVKYSEETYVQIHNLLLGDSEDGTASDLLDAGRNNFKSLIINNFSCNRVFMSP